MLSRPCQKYTMWWLPSLALERTKKQSPAKNSPRRSTGHSFSSKFSIRQTVTSSWPRSTPPAAAPSSPPAEANILAMSTSALVRCLAFSCAWLATGLVTCTGSHSWNCCLKSAFSVPSFTTSRACSDGSSAAARAARAAGTAFRLASASAPLPTHTQ